MTTNEIPLKEALYIFRINFPVATGINVKADKIEYHFPIFSTNESMQKQAQNIIDTFSLPLKAAFMQGNKRVLYIEKI
jgi:hypothetical protein